jgi:ABC-2 type transport system permease protein
MIDAVGLGRTFNGKEAASAVSFRVHHGEIFGLLRPNGAGKTPTICLLTSQIDPSGSRAFVAGYDVVKDREKLKERIGVVFEEQKLYERLSVCANLRFNCRLYNLKESRIDVVKVKSSYAVGLVLPAGFDQNLKAEPAPTLSLFINETTVNSQTETLLKTAIINYACAIADPQPPVTIGTTVINPHSTENAGVILRQVYTTLVLLLSLIVGTTYIPLLVIEEKGKKTLRLLMDTPASFSDILAGKMLVVMVFQVSITCVVLLIEDGFTGAVPLVLLYVLLGACFSLALGLLFGSLFNTFTNAGTVAGFITLVYIIGGIFVGTLGQLIGNSPILKIARILPTYLLAEGVMNAYQNRGTWSSNLVDNSVILGSTIVLIAISAWALRRQSEVFAVI